MVGESIDVDTKQYTETLRVERDVIFFLHQQADYAFLTDDIDYTMFPEKYWQVLLRVTWSKKLFPLTMTIMRQLPRGFESNSPQMPLGI